MTAPTRLLFRGSTGGGVVSWTLSAEGAVLGTFEPSGAGPVTLDLEDGRTYQLSPSS